ncbi:MAG: hypothetical protein QM754_17405 [Tepidisphaeraceae bacterium]
MRRRPQCWRLRPLRRPRLTFTIGTGWPDQARKDAAIAAMTAVLARFNAYGNFTLNNDGNVEVNYNSGVATADANYNTQIRFGGTYPAERVAQHELNHWLGSGTISQWTNNFTNGVWTGPKLDAIIKMLDGDDAVIKKSGVHFYPYGLNYDTEVINSNIIPANVAVMYAMRQDMGVGTQADPWSATNITLQQSDRARPQWIQLVQLVERRLLRARRRRLFHRQLPDAHGPRHVRPGRNRLQRQFRADPQLHLRRRLAHDQ